MPANQSQFSHFARRSGVICGLLQETTPSARHRVNIWCVRSVGPAGRAEDVPSPPRADISVAERRGRTFKSRQEALNFTFVFGKYLCTLLSSSGVLNSAILTRGRETGGPRCETPPEGYPNKYFQIFFSSCKAVWLQQRARAHGVTAEIWHQHQQGDAPGAARPSCEAPCPQNPPAHGAPEAWTPQQPSSCAGSRQRELKRIAKHNLVL